MAPLAPGLFSMMTFCPIRGLSLSAMRRATRSVGPPAGKATTRRTMREGKSCARVCAAARQDSATSARAVFERIGNHISISPALNEAVHCWPSSCPPLSWSPPALANLDRLFGAHSSPAPMLAARADGWYHPARLDCATQHRPCTALTMGECSLHCPSRQQRKGGDPVSHCHSPRLPAPVSWILPVMGVHAIGRIV